MAEAQKTDASSAESSVSQIEPSHETGKGSSGFKNAIMMTMITILIGGVFGDFIVKRNVQAYNREAETFDNLAKELDEAFAEARNQYGLALRNRRGQTQRLVRNVASGSYIIFNENYEKYNETVQHWNNIHQQMADTILDVSGCAATYALKSENSDEKKTANKAENEKQRAKRAEKIAPIRAQMDSLSDAFDKFLSKNPAAPDAIFDGLMEDRKFCPSYFITKGGETFEHSVHQQFRAMHKKLIGYKLNDFVQCVWLHENNRGEYYNACAAKSDIETLPACMAKVDSMLESHAFCSHHKFDPKKYKIHDSEFNELDYYWAAGDRFFRSFRRSYMLRECEKRMGFWGNSLDWSCEARVDEYLDSLG